MIATPRTRRLESLIYTGIWTAGVALFVLDIMRARSYTGEPLFDAGAVGRVLARMAPFLLLFVVNNYVLVPRLLFRNRLGRYLLAACVLLGAVWMLQYAFFSGEAVRSGEPHPVRMHPGPRPLLPLPLFLDLVFDLLLLGINLVIALIFQRIDDRLERESLLKANAENQLTYLKAQINPHFYLNMLNNIHGMIEIDAGRAQDMVLEMSHLMRYMLYDSSEQRIALAAETGFLRNYISLMRRRYPADKVRISEQFPPDEACAGIEVPPLLFLVFIENAFKHGISYSEESFISVSISVADGGLVEFQCLNSTHAAAPDARRGGIGLANVRRRLELIYADRFKLDTRLTCGSYLAHLIIPAYDTAHSDN